MDQDAPRDGNAVVEWHEGIRQSLQRQREYEEVSSLLRALRAADFDLGNRDNSDDERLLTQMFEEWRTRYAKRQCNLRRRYAFIRWLSMFVAGAAITLFGQDIHQWIRSHWH